MKTITIIDGQGEGNLVNGNYDVTANVPGYDNSTLNPSEITVDESTSTYAFKISADGTLILHVTEEGTEEGTPVEGATFVRTDGEGNVYGEPIVTDEKGFATFNDVPYSQTATQAVYFKQTASDGDHEFDPNVTSEILMEETTTVQIQNPLGEMRTITLTDANYENLPISEGYVII